METTTPASLICPKGHGPGVPGGAFCKTCGTHLVPADLLATVSPASPSNLDPPFMPVSSPAAATSTQSLDSPFVPLQTAAPAPAFTSVQSQAPVPAPTPVPQPAAFRNSQTSLNAQSATPASGPVAQLSVCKICGGDGTGLAPSDNICTQCGWLRPLFPGYQLDRQLFLWAQDGQAMSNLQKIYALHAAVRAVSDRVGRPWIESTFNGIRLGPRQFPDVWALAVLAARVLGLTTMPDVYISGGSGAGMWNTYTFGSDQSCFIVLGTAVLNNFTGEDLFFVLAREMGHVRAGHALWKTVSHFLVGDSNAHGLLADGILHAISPTKLIQGTIEMPLMAWSRQSDITADRAGLLAVGDEALARRVLLAWSIRSARLLKQVNIEEWMKQEDASDDAMTRFSEMTTSSSMYTTRRLRLLGQAAREPELMGFSQKIQPIRRQLTPPKPAPPARHPAPSPHESVRAICPQCNAAVRIPLAVLRGKPSLNVRCPQCKNVFTMRPPSAAPPPTPSGTTPPTAVPPVESDPQQS
ncbi:MAG: M48 family metalloprotease [Terracidiphilus sp.]